jgi:hypothetical protein
MIATALALLALTSPARVQVSAEEFGYALSRPEVNAGPAIVELVNYGEDAHDLRLRRVGGTRTYVLGKVRPGARAELEARLLPGRFVLWCSVADHRRRGMSAKLLVRRG